MCQEILLLCGYTHRFGGNNKNKKENTVKIVTRKMIYIIKIMQNTNKMQKV